MSVPRQAVIYILQGPRPELHYIGQTTLRPSQRLSCHRACALHDGHTSKLYTAMREHGVKNFTIETLEKITTTEPVSNAERRHILARNAHTTGLNTRLPREWVPPQLPQPSPDASLGELVPCTHGSTP